MTSRSDNLRILLAVTALVSTNAARTFAQRATPLDTIAVVASRVGASTARTTDVITRAEIERWPARTVADLLRDRLGVDLDSRSPAQADVSVRGSSPEQTLILVDGLRVSDAQSAHYALDLAVPLAGVERIEILRGAGSSSYGPDAVGGVINIVTRAAPGAVRSEAHGGSFGVVGGMLSAAAVHDGMTLLPSADFEKSDGHRPGADYRVGQARVMLIDSSRAGAMRTTLGAGVRDFGAAEFYAPYNSIERTSVATADVRLDNRLGSWNLSSGAGTRRHADHYVLVRDNPAVYENFHTTWQSNGQLVARTESGPLGLALGIDGAHDQLESTRLGGRREWRAGTFAEGVMTPASAVTLTAGVRGDQSSNFGAFLSPSAAAAWSISPVLQLRASGARAFRAPTWTERFYTDPSNTGNPDLKAERFWTGEVGLRTHALGTAMDLAGFQRSASNLIDWVKPAGSVATVPWQATNVGDVTYRGVEATISASPAEALDLSVYGSGLRFYDVQGAGLAGKYALRPVTRQLGARAIGRLSPSLDLGVGVTAAQRAREQGYATFNLRLGWTAGHVRAAADVVNGANANWLDASAQPVAGRAVNLSISLN